MITNLLFASLVDQGSLANVNYIFCSFYIVSTEALSDSWVRTVIFSQIFQICAV